MIYMNYWVSKMYCKFVVDILSKANAKLRLLRTRDTNLEDKLYNSYLNLEKILDQEIF